MIHGPKRAVFLLVLLLLSGSLLFAQSDSASDEADRAAAAQPSPVSAWIADNQVHRIAGYTTLGLMTATAVSGLVGWTEAHPYLGATTAAAATTSSLLGSLAYRDRLGIIWPHAVLNGLGVTGLLLNAFVFDYGSTVHRATGIASAGAMLGGYAAILLILR